MTTAINRYDCPEEGMFDMTVNTKTQDDELLRLRIAVAREVPAMHSYASKNQKHYMNGALQDPCGVHAWLAEFGA